MKSRLLVVALSLAWVLACSASGGGAPTSTLAETAPVPGGPASAAPKEVLSVLRYRKAEPLAEPSLWSAGDALFLGVDLSNLREAASPEAPVVAVLPMGAPMEVLEASSELTRVQDRVNRWYRVRSDKDGAKVEGHVFGSLLTPVLLRADLDGDGGDEVVSVTFGPDFSPRVRVMEPGMGEEEDRMLGLDLVMPELAQGGTVGVRVLPSPHHPWKLVEVKLCDVSMCVARLVSYLRDRHPLGELREIQGDPSELSFDPEGFTLEGARYKVAGTAFRAKSCPECSKVASFIPGPKRTILEMEFESESRGPHPDFPCIVQGKVVGGGFQGDELVSCIITVGGKTGPAQSYPFRFVKTSEKEWTLLEAISPSEGWANTLMKGELDKTDIAISRDATTTIYPLGVPRVLVMDSWGEIVYRYRSTGPLERPREPAFTHPEVGPVYRDLGGFAIPQPEGTFLFYNYDFYFWEDAKPPSPGTDPRKGQDYTAFPSDCDGAEDLSLTLVERTNEQLKLLATTANGQKLYVPADPQDEVYAKLYDQYSRRTEEGSRLSQAEFVASLPAYFWKDPYGQIVLFTRDDLDPPNLCEPVVYLYGRQGPVTLTLSAEIEVTASAPPVTDNAWTLLPTGDGGVQLVGSTERWPFLFWEGRNGLFDAPPGGDVVARSEVRAFLSRVLPARGLQGREIDDFVYAWAPKLEASPWVRISFHDRKDIDALVPMHLEPEPDILIRVMMEYEPLDERPRVSLPEGALPAPPSRGGFTVVEWGGVVRSAGAR